MTTAMRTVSVIGLGKLGAPMVASFASRGHQVIGVDTRPDVVGKVNEGIAPVREPELDRLLRENRSRITATTDMTRAVRDSSVTFVIVPTPSEKTGGFSLEFVLDAAETVGRALREKSERHLVVLTSTVLPGDTETRVLPALERASGKRCGEGFGLCYNPEFVALGSVVRDLLWPDFVLIGESDPDAGRELAAFYGSFLENHAPVARMNLVNAELTKIALNTFVTTKISFANVIAEACEKLPDADADVVAAALALDSRIGRKGLRGALGYGGPCFPRDNVAFASALERLGVGASLARATDEVNRRQVTRLLGHVLKLVPAGGTVGVLGLAYKPDTNVVERSQGLELTAALVSRGVSTIAYDPAALENAGTALTPKPHFASSLGECVRAADVLVVATPWPEFRSIDLADLARPDDRPRPVIVDCWRHLDRRRFSSLTHYVALGVGRAS